MHPVCFSFFIQETSERLAFLVTIGSFSTTSFAIKITSSCSSGRSKEVELIWLIRSCSCGFHQMVVSTLLPSGFHVTRLHLEIVSVLAFNNRVNGMLLLQNTTRSRTSAVTLQFTRWFGATAGNEPLMVQYKLSRPEDVQRTCSSGLGLCRESHSIRQKNVQNRYLWTVREIRYHCRLPMFMRQRKKRKDVERRSDQAIWILRLSIFFIMSLLSGSILKW